ncbi:uncharacterized protein LOC18432649 [Amborella trichopoda]|uniref:Uncharacterized protein n=1 Tax=Amborella trichopoda TaxID=13333 RepID=W1P964_AMBTC|nr:uncharacterized protein LOC18432649 [Amborella trichopoda]XP_020521969.1 uncharacterized protein LOC18432649 [Amborella trichopoda]XP_020521970.1 uncharacterized protein LOC18432649 [Amborella trichopoda]ERN04473.1 hypothetical protein AMTR_s00081p00016210 [Amborella trichopoda]|eukprot:XP_020521968.1 uncharacterized protein LOC18432649 [Amborella trichopoda]
MPKDQRSRSLSFRHSRASPFPCSSSRDKSHHSFSKTSINKAEDPKQWDDVRCPVCMEHPHNAVLLLCSSHDKGCRPYMCDTSYRHSNCLDQFRKAFTKTQVSEAEGAVHNGDSLALYGSLEAVHGSGSGVAHDGSGPVHGGEEVVHGGDSGQSMVGLACPLCRGQVKGWTVVETARGFMNLRPRGCAAEACGFVGGYAELRKHARAEHPTARPAEADPSRERDWRRLERQRDLGDVLSTIRSAMPGAMMLGDYVLESGGISDEENNNEFVIGGDDGNWLTVFLLFQVFRPGVGSMGITGGPISTRFRGRRRGVASSRRRLWGEGLEGGGDDEDGGDGDDDGDGDGLTADGGRDRTRRTLNDS